MGVRLAKEFATDPDGSRKLQRAVVNGDFRELKDAEGRFRISTNFRENAHDWNLLFWRGGRLSREDRIRVDRGDGCQVTESWKYRTNRSLKRCFFWSETESRDVSVEVYATPEAAEPRLQVDLEVGYRDTRASDREMEHSYLRFINGLSSDGVPLIPLSVGLGYSTNGRWGSIEVDTKSSYYDTGIERLLRVSRAQFFAELARVEEASPSKDELESKTLRSKASLVWRKIREARRGLGLGERMKAIARIFSKAVYRQRGFYEPRLLGLINRLIGREHIYVSGEVRAPNFAEQNFLNNAPLYGDHGIRRTTERDLLVYVPTSPQELYGMFDFLAVDATPGLKVERE